MSAEFNHWGLKLGFFGWEAWIGISSPRFSILYGGTRYWMTDSSVKLGISPTQSYFRSPYQWAGSAMIIELPDRAAVEALLADDPYVRTGLYERIDVHLWRFGGRR